MIVALQFAIVVALAFIVAIALGSIPHRWYDLPLSVTVILVTVFGGVMLLQWVGRFA